MVTRSKAQVELELRRNISYLKLCEAGSETQMRTFRRLDELLDELLSMNGAHDPDCRCEEVCAERLGRFRHLGEALTPDDIAVDGW